MRSRGLALVVLAILAAALAACAPIPGLPAPTAAPVTIVPVETSAASPLATPEMAITEVEPVVPEITIAITPTVQVTGTVEVPPATSATPVVTATTAVTPAVTSEQPLQSAPAVQMTTYRDEVGGFEIDYPATWSLVDVAPEIKEKALSYSATFTSWAPQEPGGQPMPEGGSKIDVTVTKGGAASPEAAAESRRQELANEGGNRITFEEPWDLAGGLAATHWIIQPANGEAIQELVTAINGNRVLVSGLGDAALFEQIATTLRPLAAVTEQAGAAAPAATNATPEVQATPKTSVPLAASQATDAGAQAVAPSTYTVRQGDTLAKIAARFGVTMAAILKANPQITNADRIYIGQRITIPTSGGTQPPPPAGTTRVDITMIAIGGGSVGCGDQTVAVRRDIPKTAAPLTSALNLLLAQKSQYYGQSGLYNALYQSDLRIASITRNGGNWNVYLTGTLRLGGVCDNPRVKAQLEQTAKQFSTVQSVRYFVNGQPLDVVLSEK